jgi:hypothetical protein
MDLDLRLRDALEGMKRSRPVWTGYLAQVMDFLRITRSQGGEETRR